MFETILGGDGGAAEELGLLVFEIVLVGGRGGGRRISTFFEERNVLGEGLAV